MNNELYELKDKLTTCKTGIELIQLCWNDSSKNAVAYGYICGMADSLFWAGKITQQEYTDLIKSIGL